MNAPESYREALLGDEVACFRILLKPTLHVGAHGANLHAVTARMFERRGGHLARDASPAKLRIGHDMRGDENGTIILAIVFEVPRFHATFRGNEALLVRKMSHGSHALSVAGVRGLQQVFAHFGPRIPSHERSVCSAFSSDACRATRGLALELLPSPLLSGVSLRFSPGPHHTSLRVSTTPLLRAPPRFAIFATHLASRLFLVGLSTFMNSFRLAVCRSVGSVCGGLCSTICFIHKLFGFSTVFSGLLGVFHIPRSPGPSRGEGGEFKCLTPLLDSSCLEKGKGRV